MREKSMSKNEFYTIGFTTTKGVCLDLDNITENKAEKIAEYHLKKHRLEGYLLLKSSKNHYHLVFNRYISWRKTLQIIFNLRICVEWGIWQARKGEITLRISTKKGKNKPVAISIKGKSDKLINDYLKIYKQFGDY